MNFGNDPLLNYDAAQSIQANTDDIIRQIDEMMQKRQSISMQAKVSSTPLFDEIDKIEDSFTDTQKQFLMQNQEYVESFQYVSKLVQDEELRIIRPRIEATEQGKDALKHHLSVIQKLKKEMAKEEEQRNAMISNYIKNYPGKTWEEYLEILNGQQGQPKKGGNK